MKKFKLSDWILLLVLLLAFMPGLMVYQQLPERIPSHWDIHGQVNGYSSKAFGVFFLPFLNLGMFFLLKYVPQIDPKAKNYVYFDKSYNILRWAIHVFMLGIQLVILWSNLQGARGAAPVDPSAFIVLGVCLLFIVIGNYMGRIRHNYFVGIRNPWTLASEEVWTKTHRFGGKIWVASGFIGICGILFADTLRFLFVLVPILGGSVITMAYSYWLYRKLNIEK